MPSLVAAWLEHTPLTVHSQDGHLAQSHAKVGQDCTPLLSLLPLLSQHGLEVYKPLALWS